jgi:hypothetical protein
MAALQNRLKHALNEARTLVLVAQVLLGFQFQSVFQKGFDRLPASSQRLLLVSLALVVVSFILLVAPAAYHRLVERGADSERVHRFTTRLVGAALVPFGLGLTAAAYIAGREVGGPGVGGLLGAFVGLAAFFFWFGLEKMTRWKRRAPPMRHASASAATPLDARIEQVLMELRMVLPGAQALLGFQFVILLMEKFDPLPAWSKAVHLISLGFTALATILLMTPAAYHRLAEHGEETEAFHALSGRLLLAAMSALAVGMAGDVLVVLAAATGSLALGLGAAAGVAVLAHGLWFGLALLKPQRTLPPAKTSRISASESARR